ncbi:zinc carboxypeptidase family protein [Clostridium putrefaciens]|uniref:Zinc carboxypeptidase family protein n=2 Tax=Clostridium putrefaciens TaxID=99675 RepID=A0A381J5M3_9CLOT|nr:zinc carboxypeptidase family protein [Clostridium putrefaciens]
MGSRGANVMKIQAVLKKIGYGIGGLDGIFGNETRSAVIRFQQNNGLTVNGVIGEETYEILNKFLLGYEDYILREGDNIYDIARTHYTTINKIITANPRVDIKKISIGESIVVPFGIDVVDTNIDYTYEIMERDIVGLKARYPFIEGGVLGKSVLQKNLYYIKLGNGPNEVFYNAAHHSLEWITSTLLMKFIEEFSKAYSEDGIINGYRIKDIFSKSTIYIVPMVNPDGVDLVIDGLKRDNPYYSNLIQWNKGNSDFSKDWQANIRGVDLNHNYDASWALSKQAEVIYGIYGPGPTRYSGTYPESEPETKALADFTRAHSFRLVIAYHTQGEVIYWKYLKIIPNDSRKIAEMFSKSSGYILSETTGIVSYAGYKDWFIESFVRPGYTIEVGKGKNPLPISQFDKIYRDNIEVLLLAAIV